MENVTPALTLMFAVVTKFPPSVYVAPEVLKLIGLPPNVCPLVLMVLDPLPEKVTPNAKEALTVAPVQFKLPVIVKVGVVPVAKVIVPADAVQLAHWDVLVTVTL